MRLIGSESFGRTLGVEQAGGCETLRPSARPCGWLGWGGWLYEPHPLPPNPADPPGQFPKTPKSERWMHHPWCVRLMSYHNATRSAGALELPAPQTILTYSATGQSWDGSQTAWWRGRWGPFIWQEAPLREAGGGDAPPTGAQLHALLARETSPDARRYFPFAPFPLPRRGLQESVQFPVTTGVSACRIETLLPLGAPFNLFVKAVYYRKTRAQGTTGPAAERANVWMEAWAFLFHVAPLCEEGA